MSYIIILNPTYTTVHIVTDMRGFKEEFYDYELAKEEAEKYLKSGDARDYEIYQLVKE